MPPRARSLTPDAPLLVLCLAVLAMPMGVAAQGLTVSGYADFETWVNKIGSDDKELYFDNHHVNLIMVGQVTGDLYMATEIEYEHAGEEIAFEYGYFGYTGFEDVRIMAGKFIVPFGRFNKDLHPTPINKLPFRPNGFSQVLPQTYNDVGLWVSGAKPVNDDARFVFDLFAINGLLGDDGGSIRSARDNDREKAGFGRDDNKALGGRLGFDFPFQGFDFGASLYTGKYAETDGGTSLNLTLLGVDAAYQTNGFVLRGELVRASQEATGGDLTKTGGYAQASYWLNDRVEPAIRFSTRDFPGEDSDQSRVALGLNFMISPAALVRVAYAINNEKSGFEKENDSLVIHWNVIF